MNDMIIICKKPGIKQCVRINSEADIPDKLKEVVKIENGSIILDCMEGVEEAPLGSVIAFEENNGKMNVWNKRNWKTTLQEINGVFYENPKPNRAIRVSDNFEDIIKPILGDRYLGLKEDGNYHILTKSGDAKCAPNEGYFVIYNEDITEFNFLNKNTDTFRQYYVLDENNNFIQTLEEYDKQIQDDKSSQQTV